jgi:hypothetical protein
MIDAFMKGREAAKHGKKVLDNPYPMGYTKDLWDQGFLHYLESKSDDAY